MDASLKTLGDMMTELDKGKTVSLEELMVSTLAMADAVTKLLIEKGVISEAEFRDKLLEERATYQKLLNPTAQ
jgi:ribosomal protein S8